MRVFGVIQEAFVVRFLAAWPPRYRVSTRVDVSAVGMVCESRTIRKPHVVSIVGSVVAPIEWDIGHRGMRGVTVKCWRRHRCGKPSALTAPRVMFIIAIVATVRA